MVQGERTQLEQWDIEYSQDAEYVAEGMAADTIEQVITKMEELRISRSQLASILQVSRQRVSRMLDAPPNLRYVTVAHLAIALGTKPKLVFDSESYLIRSIRESVSAEEMITDLAYQRDQYSANHSAFPSKVGLTNATA